jgi:hypothetical protein
VGTARGLRHGRDVAHPEHAGGCHAPAGRHLEDRGRLHLDRDRASVKPSGRGFRARVVEEVAARDRDRPGAGLHEPGQQLRVRP